MAVGFQGTNSFEPDDGLIVGMDDIISRQITLASGQNLKRGALLGRVTAGGKYVLSLTAAADGSQAPAVILAEATDASASDKTTVAYFAGTFDTKSMVIGTGHTADSIREGLRPRNINLQTSMTR